MHKKLLSELAVLTVLEAGPATGSEIMTLIRERDPSLIGSAGPFYPMLHGLANEGSTVIEASGSRVKYLLTGAGLIRRSELQEALEAETRRLRWLRPVLGPAGVL